MNEEIQLKPESAFNLTDICVVAAQDTPSFTVGDYWISMRHLFMVERVPFGAELNFHDGREHLILYLRDQGPLRLTPEQSIELMEKMNQASQMLQAQLQQGQRAAILNAERALKINKSRH